ncbi:hypothetical protein [Marinactinospora rubrisoli]|uniref:Uncharacterized protein n=1 Tax=Marinactinospora rubrisoli TaxID=2715399 RepID=A0ABW2KQ75_9ACTN
MSSDTDDEPYFSDDLHEEEGWVSIWLNTGFDEENDTIGWFDHDHSEAGGAGPEPIRDLLTGFSDWESWIDAAERHGRHRARYVWMPHDHVYTVPPGRMAASANPEPDDPDFPAYFLGSFRYHPG